MLSVNLPTSTTDKALNKQSTVQVNVTDSDGATAANTFGIRWHYPKENATLFASGQPFWQEVERKQVTAVGYINGDATGTFGYSTYRDFFPTASSALFNTGTTLPNPIWAAFAGAVGFVFSQTQPEETPASTNFNQCWDEPLSTGLPTPRDHALMDQYEMKPLLFVKYQEQTWEYEQYGQKGYLGQAQEGFNHFMGRVRSAGEYKKTDHSPPGV